MIKNNDKKGTHAFLTLFLTYWNQVLRIQSWVSRPYLVIYPNQTIIMSGLWVGVDLRTKKNLNK